MSEANGSLDLAKLPQLPRGWEWSVASDICSIVASGSTPTSDKMFAGSGDVPFIKVYNLTHHGALNFSVKPTFIGKSTHKDQLKRSITKPGDVLINIVGPPLGKVSVGTTHSCRRTILTYRSHVFGKRLRLSFGKWEGWLPPRATELCTAAQIFWFLPSGSSNYSFRPMRCRTIPITQKPRVGRMTKPNK